MSIVLLTWSDSVFDCNFIIFVGDCGCGYIEFQFVSTNLSVVILVDLVECKEKNPVILVDG